MGVPARGKRTRTAARRNCVRRAVLKKVAAKRKTCAVCRGSVQCLHLQKLHLPHSTTLRASFALRDANGRKGGNKLRYIAWDTLTHSCGPVKWSEVDV